MGKHWNDGETSHRQLTINEDSDQDPQNSSATDNTEKEADPRKLFTNSPSDVKLGEAQDGT